MWLKCDLQIIILHYTKVAVWDHTFLAIDSSTATGAMAMVTVPSILTGPSSVTRVALAEVGLVRAARLRVVVLHIGGKIQELVVDVDVA